ncbi:MAG: ABC transporter ATP-binding protein [Patescibacteria group bacterium]|nr:ABC transporter ATP-binding protein [Patescibacteria group bacterium]
MSNPVIQVENLSKYYRLGLIGGGTLNEDINRWIAKIRGKPDPLLKVGEKDHGNRKDGQIWALRDVNLEVNEGEILGIIGRNGAGKSTLLKILSKITAPTEGRVKIRGRVGSLLEVGTGFHPELTGRENIYLNGTILGMSHAEVSSKLEEIVEFAEMGKFIDTPVKRYSSGMTVRLAFAVAAHLEPEILVIDEVLAVGDVAFQHKCINHMSEIQQTGRTILFVSHNMDVMQRLCSKAVLLHAGEVADSGPTSEVVQHYLSTHVRLSSYKEWQDSEMPGSGTVSLKSARVYSKDDSPKTSLFDIKEPILIEFTYDILRNDTCVSPSFLLYDTSDTVVFMSGGTHDLEWIEKPRKKGRYRSRCTIPGNFLAEGLFRIRAIINTMSIRSATRPVVHVDEVDALSFKVHDPIDGCSARAFHTGAYYGVVRPILSWETDVNVSQ